MKADLPPEILEKIKECNFISDYCNGRATGADAVRIAELLLEIISYDDFFADRALRKSYGF